MSKEPSRGKVLKWKLKMKISDIHVCTVESQKAKGNMLPYNSPYQNVVIPRGLKGMPLSCLKLSNRLKLHEWWYHATIHVASSYLLFLPKNPSFPQTMTSPPQPGLHNWK